MRGESGLFLSNQSLCPDSLPLPLALQADKTWINRGCTQSCTCKGGAIQCQKYHCSSGTYCKDMEDDSSSCATISKGATGSVERVCSRLKRPTRGRARGSLVPLPYGIKEKRHHSGNGLWVAIAGLGCIPSHY